MEQKPIYQSFSFNGIIVMLVTAIFDAIQVIETKNYDPTTIANIIAKFVGAIIALYGVIRRKDIYIFSEGDNAKEQQ